MTTLASTESSPREFPRTRWSVVLAATQAASPGSAAALESICQAYWFPLYAYVRRSGQSPQDAQDLTQEFFCRLLAQSWLADADPAKGKLRTFLIVALKHFMSKEWRRASAQKRGGGMATVPIDTVFAESQFATDHQLLAPEETFDQQWALTLLHLTINRLRAEFANAGRPDDFELLKDCLMADRGSIDYPAVARALGFNEGAARVAVHRLRKRFREIYREEISQTLADGADLQAELHHLAAALARK